MATTQKDLEALERARSIKDVPWCEEYEAMISGMMFRSWESAVLERGRLRALRLCKEYNKTDSFEDGVEQADVLRSRVDLLHSLLGEFKGAPNIEPPFSVLYGCNTSVGRNFFGNVGLAIDDSAFVTIGDNVIIGPNVHFITINHPTDVAERIKGGMHAHPITVGSGCWIGARATILPGATIGYGCTIGASAVVSGYIPEYSVAVGVPARVVKRVTPALPASTAGSTLDMCEGRSPHEEVYDAEQSAF